MIQRLIPGGRGFTQTATGKAVFVRSAYPGDRVRLQVERETASFMEARIASLVEPSPERVPAACQYVTVCGGCDWMGLSAPAQARGKRALLLDALTRVGGVSEAELPAELVVHSAPPRQGYRLRLRLQIQNGKVGFFQAESHNLTEIEACWVAAPELNDLLGQVRALVHQAPRAWKSVDFVEVRVLPPAPQSALPPVAGPERASVYVSLLRGAPLSTQLRQAVEPLRAQAVVRFSTEAEPQPQRYWLTEDLYSLIPVGGFCQVHAGVNRRLVERVLDFAEQAQIESFLDLYCGSGNFSLPLAQLGKTGQGIEWSREAIAAAKQAAQEQGLPSVQFRAGDVAEEARRLVRKGAKYDLVLADPPRAGVKKSLAEVFALSRRWLLLVSCDPVTLARDLKSLLSWGARLHHLEAWDMFPETHHVESFAVLRVPEQETFP